MRDGEFVKKAKQIYFERNVKGKCEKCGKTQNELYGIDIEKKDFYLELHHKKPFSEILLKKTYGKINDEFILDNLKQDFEFLCPNCHYISDKNNKDV